MIKQNKPPEEIKKEVFVNDELTVILKISYGVALVIVRQPKDVNVYNIEKYPHLIGYNKFRFGGTTPSYGAFFGYINLQNGEVEIFFHKGNIVRVKPRVNTPIV